MKKATKKKLLSLLPALTVIGLIGVLGVGFAVAAFSGAAPKYLVEGDLNVTEVVTSAPLKEVGVFPGTDIYQPINFNAGFGGRMLVTSTDVGSHTLSEADLNNFDIFEYTVLNHVAFALTLPATSTMSSVLSTAGDRRQWLFRNYSTSTSATVITLTAGTGWELTGVDTNVDTIAAGGWAQMDCYRMSASSTFNMVDTVTASNILCNIQELVAAD